MQQSGNRQDFHKIANLVEHCQVIQAGKILYGDFSEQQLQQTWGTISRQGTCRPA